MNALSLEYLLQGELPLDKVETRQLALWAKTFVLLGKKGSYTDTAPREFSSGAYQSAKVHRC
jgi:hypothetical protein